MQAEADRLADLLRAVAAGDRPAFAELYRQTAAQLFGVALRIVRQRDRAEDVLQESFVAIWRRACDYDPARGKAAKFFQALGFRLEFETDHNSGQLRNGDGPHLFIAEVPTNEKPEAHVVLKVPYESLPESIVDVVMPFEDTHWGTREMTVRDPDGRIWRLQTTANKGAHDHERQARCSAG